MSTIESINAQITAIPDNISEVSGLAVTGVFRPELLSEGGDSMREQLDLWANSDNMSIFIEWIPDQMTEQSAIELFQLYGKVSSVHFKISQTPKGKKRSAYVNFIAWNRDEQGQVHEVIEEMAQVYPGYYPVKYETFADKRGTIPKTFELKCRVNKSKSTVSDKPKPAPIVQQTRPPVLRRQTNQKQPATGPPPIRTNQVSIDSRVAFLEKENEALWREITILKGALFNKIR